MDARWRTVVTIGFVVLLALPLAGTGDGVPLSSYPMYATPRSAEVTFVVAMGQTADGELVELSPTIIAGSPDPLIVESYLRREVEAGRSHALCATIANRAGSGVTTIEIRLDRYLVVDRVLDTSPPISSQLLASCPVK